MLINWGIRRRSTITLTKDLTPCVYPCVVWWISFTQAPFPFHLHHQRFLSASDCPLTVRQVKSARSLCSLKPPPHVKMILFQNKSHSCRAALTTYCLSARWQSDCETLSPDNTQTIQPLTGPGSPTGSHGNNQVLMSLMASEERDPAPRGNCHISQR